MKFDQWKTLISGEGLKTTRQRKEILDIFLNLPSHQNLSQIYSRVVKTNPKIGYTTVYRTLKLFTRLGLAVQRKFADGETRYEPAAEGSHHDHLICLDCGKIIEFENDALESLQDQIAKRHRFRIDHHKMELYGQCMDCASKKRASGKKG